jgi:hypothetical protein
MTIGASVPIPVAVARTPNDAANTAAIGAIGAIARTPSRYERAAGARVAMSAGRAILTRTMRGPNLLLAHLEWFADLVAEEPGTETPRPTARERLEAAVGPELARDLLAACAGPAPEGK